jgi:hypothetical protein
MTIHAVDAGGASYSPLVCYALKGLENCWLAEHGCWSHCYHLDGRPQPNQSIPESDVFYSLNVLLGMSRLTGRDRLPYDIKATLERCSLRLLTLPVRTYAFGMALWASAELRLELPLKVESHIHALLSERRNWQGFTAQDIGMLLTGLSAQFAAGNRRGEHLLRPLFDFMVENYTSSTGLFYNSPGGWRRSFASFATQTYLTIACYNVAGVLKNERALALAAACVHKLISLQGPQGEWPWFYHVPSGKVVDFYEVYSVHQDGMAPAFLEHAERHGLPGARKALVRGFEWIYGANQLCQSMLRPEVGMIVRSHVRKGEIDSKVQRLVRSSWNALAGSSQGLTAPSQLTLRLECRSYHLGWVLWSFGARHDLPSITHAKALVEPRVADMLPSLH